MNFVFQNAFYCHVCCRSLCVISNQDLVLWAWLEMVFLPLLVPTLTLHILFPVIVFSAQYPKRYRKISCCGPFEA